MMNKVVCMFCLSLFCFACVNESNNEIHSSYSFKEIPTHCIEGGEANLFVSNSGHVFLSWVEYLNDTTDALKFSVLKEDVWSDPRTIAKGSDWFVNWADFPSIVAYTDDSKSLAAHWLQKSTSGTYDYDIRISQSQDGGVSWKPSFVPHRDSIEAEHGFVSLLPLPDNKIFASWLDGRNTKTGSHTQNNHEHNNHGHGGSMTLRCATFDKEGKLYDEFELDSRVCDCCQTSAALTDKGVIVAYRDRSDDEIRDISVVRNFNGEWTSPQVVFNDNWKISGCPVNGPDIVAKDSTVAIAWYSMADGDPEVKVSFSNNSGESFLPPIKIDNGNPLGRVDIILLSDQEAMVSWMEEVGDEALIKAIRISALSTIGDSFIVAKSASSRSSGFPRMVNKNKNIYFAWTAVDSTTKVKTAFLRIN